MADKKITTESVLIKPRMTEKALISGDKRGVYVFEVAKDATKSAIAGSVKAEYKVTPVRVRTAVIPSKNVFRGGKFGTKSGGKKAYVYLKKGDKIELL